MPLLNLTQTFFAKNSHRGNKIAFIDNNRSITFQELETQTRKMATWLINHDVVPGDRLNLVMLDRIDTVVTFLAISLLGATAVMCNPRAKIETLQSQVDIIKPKLVLTEENLTKHFGNNCHVITEILSQINDLPEYTHDPITQEKDVAFMVWTSGTTGRSKAVMHTHYNVIKQSKNLVKVLDQTENDRLYSTPKLFFAFGLITILFNTMWSGATCFIESGLAIPGTVRKNIKNFQPTQFFSVPIIYSQLLNLTEPFNLKAKCVVGGENLPESLIHNWKISTGNDLYNLFGVSEGLTALTLNFESTTSLGKALPDTEIRVVDEHGDVVPTGQVGFLQVKAPCIGVGYYNDLEWSAKTFKEWLQTGDLIYQDSDSRFYYVGRAADAIKINGQYVNPVHLEERLQSFPGVEQAAVIFKPGLNGIPRIEAFVVPMQNTQINVSDLKPWILSKHEKFECPRVFHVVESLPRTDNGKLQRYILREQLA